jgi:hypothetical protein
MKINRYIGEKITQSIHRIYHDKRTLSKNISCAMLRQKRHNYFSNGFKVAELFFPHVKHF